VPCATEDTPLEVLGPAGTAAHVERLLALWAWVYSPIRVRSPLDLLQHERVSAEPKRAELIGLDGVPKGQVPRALSVSSVRVDERPGLPCPRHFSTERRGGTRRPAARAGL
jgi:hypothetical protein